MWPVFLTISTLTATVWAQTTIPGTGIERHVGESTTSMGYKVVYGDEDITYMNELVTDQEKQLAKKHKEQLKLNIEPLDIEDIKCLVSVDRFCSTEMKELKSVIVQAVKEDCKQCSETQKEKAGRAIASMMAHEPMAWKLFLTRFLVEYRKPKVEKLEKVKRNKRAEPKYVEDGEMDKSIVNIRTIERKALPGVRVRHRAMKVKVKQAT